MKRATWVFGSVFVLVVLVVLWMLFLGPKELPPDEPPVAVSREIAAAAFLRGEIDTAESALNEILQQLPDDLDALNRMGHIHDLRGRLSDAEAWTWWDRLCQQAYQDAIEDLLSK